MNNRSVDLWKYIPPFLKEIEEYKEIINAESPEFQTLIDNSKGLLDNSFISTALEDGIKKYESILGITPNASDTLDVRRRRILSMWDDDTSFTIKGLEEKIKIIQGNNDISIYLDENDPYLLHVITGYYDQDRILEIRNLVRSIVPANLETDVRSRMETEEDVYGFEFDLIAKKTARLGACSSFTPGSDFDNASPWGGRYRCNITDDGVEVAKYGDAAFSETGYLTTAVTVNGVTYPVGTQIQVMVKQPKFYYCVIPIGLENIDGGIGTRMMKVRCFISESEHDLFKLHPLFLDENGNELDYVYLSAYEATYYDVSANSYVLDNSQTVDANADKLASIANAEPVHDTGVSGTTRTFDLANFRKLANNRGNGWYQAFIKSFSATQLLFLIEYGSLYAVTSSLIGGSNRVDTLQVTGKTTALGNESGKVFISNVGCLISYRGEENIIGNINLFVDGILLEYTSEGQIVTTHVCDGYDFSDEFDNYETPSYKTPIGVASGWISSFCYDEDYDWLFMPCDLTLNVSTTLITDKVLRTSIINNKGYILLGGYLNYTIGFYSMNKLFTEKNTTTMAPGSRLVYIPQHS